MSRESQERRLAQEFLLWLGWDRGEVGACVV